jgi:hypothetical protein
MRTGLLALALLAPAACNGRPEPTPAPRAAPPAIADSKDAAMPTTILRPLAIPALALDALAPAGDLHEDSADGIRSVRIVTGPVRVAFSRGPAATLDELRTSLPGQLAFEPEADAKLCGLPARRLVASSTPPMGTGARSTPDGQLVFEPGGGTPTTFVAVATRRGAAWIRVVWIVATAERARYQSDETSFFAGVRCR